MDYIFPLYFKKCTTASAMNTNMEMNPKALRERKVSCIKKWKKKLQIETREEDWREPGNE